MKIKCEQRNLSCVCLITFNRHGKPDLRDSNKVMFHRRIDTLDPEVGSNHINFFTVYLGYYKNIFRHVKDLCKLFVYESGRIAEMSGKIRDKCDSIEKRCESIADRCERLIDRCIKSIDECGSIADEFRFKTSGKLTT